MPEAYYCWLVGLLGNDYLLNNYQKLLWKLYLTEFYWELDYDSNRAADGLYLRKLFEREHGLAMDGRILGNENCSVLEMMIALARDAENEIMHDPDLGDRTGEWFWVMIQNLGLDSFDDYGFFGEEVDRILYIFMHHLYAPDGYGGAFPCFGIERDMRKTDLWWQMNAYLEEHYPV